MSNLSDLDMCLSALRTICCCSRCCRHRCYCSSALAGSPLLVIPPVTGQAMASAEVLAAPAKIPVFVLEEAGSSLHLAVCCDHAGKPWTEVAWLVMKAHSLRTIKDPRLRLAGFEPMSTDQEFFNAIIRVAGIVGVPLSGDGDTRSVLLSISGSEDGTLHPIAVGIGMCPLTRQRAAYLAAAVAARKDEKHVNWYIMQYVEVIDLPVAETLVLPAADIRTKLDSWIVDRTKSVDVPPPWIVDCEKSVDVPPREDDDRLEVTKEVSTKEAPE